VWQAQSLFAVSHSIHTHVESIQLVKKVHEVFLDVRLFNRKIDLPLARKIWLLLFLYSIGPNFNLKQMQLLSDPEVFKDV
jgi:hypothetical protein